MVSRRFLLSFLGASIFGFGIFAVAANLVAVNVVPPGSDSGVLVLAFIQLVALYFPALAIFLQVLLEHSYRKADQQGKSGGVGSLGPDEFRWGVFLVGGISSLFLIIGIVALVAALDIPSTIEAGTAIILFGLMFAPLAILYVAILEFRDL